MIRHAVPGLALMLAACAAPAIDDNGRDPAPAPGAYMAFGSQPSWTLEITAATIRFDEAAAAQVVVATPPAQPLFNGRRYAARRIALDIAHAPCSDAASERRYADTVTIRLDDRAFHGCGGDILPPADLAGTRWRMLTVDGVAVTDPARTGLDFDGESVAGSAGCNRFSGTYRSDGTRLTAGPFTITEMACPGAVGEQERAVLSVLAAPVSIRFAAERRLILMGDGGRSIVLEPAM